MPAALIELKYAHVHDCRADAEGRPCRFDWTAHAETGMCACDPVVDERDMMLNGQVFVVHKGVC